MAIRCDEGEKGHSEIGLVAGAPDWYTEHLNSCAQCRNFEKELEVEKKKGQTALVPGMSCSHCRSEATAGCPHIQSNELIASTGGRPAAIKACFLPRD